jgi:hypothetical protein
MRRTHISRPRQSEGELLMTRPRVVRGVEDEPQLVRTWLTGRWRLTYVAEGTVERCGEEKVSVVIVVARECWPGQQLRKLDSQ